MASEKEFELLDDYIGNRLTGDERMSFENRLQADPDLQRELKVQQGIVDSLRRARAAELKAMLNNIPPSAIPADSSALAKWASVGVVILVAVGLYFYLKPSDDASLAPVTDSVTVAPPAATEQSLSTETEEDTEDAIEPVEGTSPQEPVANGNPKPTQKPAASAEPGDKPGTPEMNVFDPSEEEEGESAPPETNGLEVPADERAKTSDITSEIVTEHKTYTFHYQFRDDKLILYGAFDKNLYSILEFFTDNKRTIFLEYKNNFYLLNQSGDKVKPLSPVNDPVLIQKLREH